MDFRLFFSFLDQNFGNPSESEEFLSSPGVKGKIGNDQESIIRFKGCWGDREDGGGRNSSSDLFGSSSLLLLPFEFKIVF